MADRVDQKLIAQCVSQLASSKLATTNNAEYQLLVNLIKSIQQIATVINALP